jgi:hypothetical protein
MDAKMSELHSCLSTLREVIMSVSRGSDGLSKIKAVVVPEFDTRSLDWSVGDVGQIHDAKIMGEYLIVRFLSSISAYPFRAGFRKSGDGQWRLATFEGACPACFGDGLLDGQTCYVCDGQGYHAQPKQG